MLNYNIILIAIVVSSVVFLFIFNFVVVCICFYKLSSKTSTGNAHMQPAQPVYYETVMECNTVELKMTENVAYAPIQLITK